MMAKSGHLPLIWGLKRLKIQAEGSKTMFKSPKNKELDFPDRLLGVP
jgi:hypothetical protein